MVLWGAKSRVCKEEWRSGKVVRRRYGGTHGAGALNEWVLYTAPRELVKDSSPTRVTVVVLVVVSVCPMLVFRQLRGGYLTRDVSLKEPSRFLLGDGETGLHSALTRPYYGRARNSVFCDA